mgnify:CR=1 FL=1
MGNKASSSGQIKPPMADELLNHYTHEQLRAHFLALNVGNTSSSFNPKVYKSIETNPSNHKALANTNPHLMIKFLLFDAKYQ